MINTGPVRGFKLGLWFQIQHIVPTLPQVAYGASSPVLDDRQEFEFLARTNLPDSDQANIMAELLSKLNSENHRIEAVNLLYSSTFYGKTAAQVSGVFVYRRQQLLLHNHNHSQASDADYELASEFHLLNPHPS